MSPASKRLYSPGMTSSCNSSDTTDPLWDDCGDILILLVGKGVERRCRVQNKNLVRRLPLFDTHNEAEDAKPGQYVYRLEEKVNEGTVPRLLRFHDLTQVSEKWTPKDDTQNNKQAQAMVKLESTGSDCVPMTPPAVDGAVDLTDLEIIKAYENLLLIGLDEEPRFPTTDILAALNDFEALLAVCDFYDFVVHVTPYINSSLIEYRADLFRAISLDPPRWLKLGIALKSGLVYAESFCHIAGCFPSWPWCSKSRGIGENVMRKIEEKSRVLAIRYQTAYCKLLTNSVAVDDGLGQSVSVTAHSNLGTWCTMQIYRDEVAREIAALQSLPKNESHNRGSFFRRIYQGGDAYASLDKVLEQRREIGGKALLDLEDIPEDLNILKDFAKDAVGDLGKNRLMLDLTQNDIEYLTCVEVGVDDYPCKARRR